MKGLVLSCALALGLAGCASAVNTAVSDINSLTGALSSPAATQAAANLKAGAKALACDVSGASALADQIAAAVKAGTAVIRDASSVYVVSSDVCAALGGAPIGPAIVGQS
ncbi:MAG: hypothetical protein ABR878_01665 [Roseiarcus sp.]|jgi:hypothetical protein